MKTNIKSYFLRLNIIYLVLNIGVLIFLFISLYSNSDKEQIQNNTDPLFLACIGLFVFELIASKFVIGSMVSKMKLVDFNEKLVMYQKRTVVGLALFEGLGLFSVVAYLVTVNIYSLFITPIALLMMFIHKPSKFKLISESEMNKTDKLSLDNEQTEIILPNKYE